MLALLVVPIVELIVIIQVATRIGFFETLAVLILISVAGAWLVRREGAAAWRRVQAAMARGEIPTNEAIDGVLVVIGGALLLTPGFVTDLVGFLFLIPVARGLARRWGRRLAGIIALRRFGPAGAAAGAGKKIYDARVTRARSVTDPSATGPLPPGEPRRPNGEDGSPGS